MKKQHYFPTKEYRDELRNEVNRLRRTRDWLAITIKRNHKRVKALEDTRTFLEKEIRKLAHFLTK